MGAVVAAPGASVAWLGKAKARAWSVLPTGGTLPEEVWRRRHHGILALLWLHVPAILVFTVGRGEPLSHAVVEAGVVAAFAVVASALGQHRRHSTLVASLGLLTCSAVLVHVSGGVIEMHFHFFVMVGVITLYQDWQPFLVAIGYVVVQHGLAGALWPHDVYNHQAAWNQPWKWAGIHGLFILGMSAAGIANWRLNEAMRGELVEASEQFRSAFDDAPIGMAITDVDGRFLRVNQALVELVGYAEGQLLATSLEDLAAPEDEAIRAGDGLGSEAGSYRAEKRWVTGGGGAIRVLVSASVVRDAAGDPLHVIWQVEDVTERRQAEEALVAAHAELEQSNDDLRRSNADLQQFAYVASHDLSEPLRAISGPMQLLARQYGGQLDGDAQEFISFAVDGCKRMQTLIDDLLSYSRVGRREVAFGPVDCSEVVRHVLASLSGAVAERGATVTVDPLPTVLAEAGQLGQLFQNLIANALKFVPPGTNPAVHVSAGIRDGTWCFTVTDNGIGIDPRYEDRIFLMFKRLHDRDTYPGTGMGLAICKKIVERHGGQIWAEPAPGGGSRFCFTVRPVAEAAA